MGVAPGRGSEEVSQQDLFGPLKHWLEDGADLSQFHAEIVYQDAWAINGDACRGVLAGGAHSEPGAAGFACRQPSPQETYDPERPPRSAGDTRPGVPAADAKTFELPSQVPVRLWNRGRPGCFLRLVNEDRS